MLRSAQHDVQHFTLPEVSYHLRSVVTNPMRGGRSPVAKSTSRIGLNLGSVWNPYDRNTGMNLLIFYLLLALGVSFLCSLVEAGILSLRRTDVARLVKEGRSTGKLLEAMKKNVDRPLSAILTLNTVAHTVGAAGVGAQSLTLFGSQWVAATSAVLTVLVLIFSEIIPKTIGAFYAARLAGFTAYTIRGMIVLTYPLVLVFQALSRVIAHRGGKDGLTREEFTLLAEIGHAEGAILEKEHRVIRNLLRLRQVRIKEVMTPRTVAFMLSKDLTVKEVVEQHVTLRFSRIPVFGNGPDDLVGLVHRREIYESLDKAPGRKLGDLARPIHAVPEDATIDIALDEFVERREHLFIAVDEYGGTAGVITLEDALETLLGAEIVDETDAVADMRELAGQLFQDKLYGRRF